MSGALLVGLVGLHVVMWIVQVMVNSIGGGSDCVDISSFACGSPVLQSVAEIVHSTDTGGFLGLAIALGNVLKGIFPLFFGLIFFDYGWLHGGGQLVDLMVTVLRVVLGAVFLGVMYRAAVSIVGGVLGRSG